MFSKCSIYLFIYCTTQIDPTLLHFAQLNGEIHIFLSYLFMIRKRFALTLSLYHKASLTFKKIAPPFTPLFSMKVHHSILRNAFSTAIPLPTLLPLNREPLIVTRAPSQTWITETLLAWFEKSPCSILTWHPDSIVIAEPLAFELNSESLMVMPSSPKWQFEMCTKAAFIVQLVKTMCDMITPGDLQAQWPTSQKYIVWALVNWKNTCKGDMPLRVCNVVRIWSLSTQFKCEDVLKRLGFLLASIMCRKKNMSEVSLWSDSNLENNEDLLLIMNTRVDFMQIPSTWTQQAMSFLLNVQETLIYRKLAI